MQKGNELSNYHQEVVAHTEKGMSDVVALGLPGRILYLSMKFTGLHGAPKLTSALKALGGDSMHRGPLALGAVGVVSKEGTEVMIGKIAFAMVRQLYRQGKTKNTILNRIEGYPIAQSLKAKLKEELKIIDCHESL